MLLLYLKFVSMDTTQLERVTFTQFSGVFIDEKLNWKIHTLHLGQKISKSIGVINHVKKLFPRDIYLKLYHTMIQPYLYYCNLI